MLISDTIKEFKRTSTIKEYTREIEKHGKIHSKQTEFIELLVSLVYNQQEKEAVDVIPARCGIGKSIATKSILNNLVNNYRCIEGSKPNSNNLKPYGAIIITDSIERLENIARYKGLENRCYLMKFDKEDTESNCRIQFKKQVEQQHEYPILLMTTQKYFSLQEKDREFIYTWEKGNRKICIIDEKPILFSEETIDEKYLSTIRIALHKCYEGDEKKYLLDTFDKIYSDLDYIRKTYSAEYEVMWLKKSKTTLLLNTDEDNRFFKILSDNVSRSIYYKVQGLKRIYSEGCLFVSKKNKQQDNIRQFIVMNDNSDKFDTEKCKYFILDATAMFDMDYLIDQDTFNYIDIDDKKDIKDITIHHIPFNTSQNSLQKKDRIETISGWINNKFKKEVFVVTYGKKSGIYQQFNKLLETDTLAYFGSIKGKNDWQNNNTMIHIGFNRQSDVVYLINYIHLFGMIDEWNDMETFLVASEVDRLLYMDSGLFIDEDMNDIMRSKILVDTEQNIMRIKCRNFSNEEMCNVYIIASEYYSGYINRVASKLNACVVEEFPDDFCEYKIMSRNTSDGKQSNAQKILHWINNVWDGKEIKTKDMLEQIGISKSQFSNAKKNIHIKTTLNNYTIKKGYYKK